MNSQHPLLDIDGLDLEAKARRISDHFLALHDHPSGIFYSLMKIDGDAIRAFQPSDFEGVTTFDFKGWRIKPAGSWEYRNNENSLTTAGYWLAAQVERYHVTQEADALHHASRAYQCLDAIYKFGEEDGRPGWMGKPYGFKLSDQTSGDQYLFAAWGLAEYAKVAPKAEAARSREMLVGMANYWKQIDYKIFYLDHVWDNRENLHAYNAIFVYLNTLAYDITGEGKYLNEAREFRAAGKWDHETTLDEWKREAATKDSNEWPPNRIVGDQLKPGEYLCWETTIHSLFTAVSATGTHHILPELVDRESLAQTLKVWLEPWTLGVEDDLLPYYFFLVNLNEGTWRPAQNSPKLPRSEWFLGSPGLSQTTTRRWTEPLGRTLVTAMLAGEHSPEVAAEAKSVARRIMESINGTRMQWQIDPDGKQIAPDRHDVINTLSSEIPSAYVFSFWRGRRLGWW